MKYLRFAHANKVSYGVLSPDGGSVRELTASPFGDHSETGLEYPLSSVVLLPPCEPSKVVVIGLNYAGHVAESNRETPAEPLISMKAPSSLIGHGASVTLRNPNHVVHFEGELAVVIGRQCHSVLRQDAEKYVFGYTCANDVSDRTLQHRDGQWVRAKSFDTFGPLGPFIETDVSDTSALFLTTRLNGETRQSSPVSDLIFDVPTLVEAVTSVMTLLPGDVILTGTPSGVGAVAPGDVVEVSIDGVCKLVNHIEAGTT